MVNIIKYLFFITILTFFSACSMTQEDITGTFQTNSAELITKDRKAIQELLVKFKSKLDKRNPKNYNKNNEYKIYRSIKNFNSKLFLKKDGKILKDYRKYLQIAFNKDLVLNRNDYLILGIAYMVADSYFVKDFHALTALQFDEKKLQNLYQNLQVIRWKIKVDKDLNNNYLFLTWQNNWQIQLEKLLENNPNISYEEIKKLKYIQNREETLFSHSNFSFEVLLTQMIDRVENSLEALGDEPKDLSISALTFFVFL